MTDVLIEGSRVGAGAPAAGGRGGKAAKKTTTARAGAKTTGGPGSRREKVKLNDGSVGYGRNRKEAMAAAQKKATAKRRAMAARGKKAAAKEATAKKTAKPTAKKVVGGASKAAKKTVAPAAKKASTAGRARRGQSQAAFEKAVKRSQSAQKAAATRKRNRPPRPLQPFE